MAPIVIKSPVLVVDNNVGLLSADLVFPDGARRLWFQFDAGHTDKLSGETCDGFLVAALVVAMRRGLDIVVEGPLSSRLYYNVANHYMELLRNLVPGTRKVAIEAKQLTREKWGGTGVLAGFSAGVDSFCTLLDHQAGRVPDEYRLTGLIFNNVGSHGQSKNDLSVFHDRLARLTTHARVLRLPLVAVNSNLDPVIDLDFQLTHTLRNVAVALLFQKAFAKYLYSSTVHYRDTHVGKIHDMGHADALGVGLLSTETMECISSGGQHTRFEKTEIVSTFALSHRMLDVCVAPTRARKTNCSKCWKCLRTQVTLEVIGALDEYGEVFDLDVYRRFRGLYFCSVMGSRDPLQREIRDEIRKRNFRVPLTARCVAAIVPDQLIELALRAGEFDRQRFGRALRRLARWTLKPQHQDS